VLEGLILASDRNGAITPDRCGDSRDRVGATVPDPPLEFEVVAERILHDGIEAVDDLEGGASGAEPEAADVVSVDGGQIGDDVGDVDLNVGGAEFGFLVRTDKVMGSGAGEAGESDDVEVGRDLAAGADAAEIARGIGRGAGGRVIDGEVAHLEKGVEVVPAGFVGAGKARAGIEIVGDIKLLPQVADVLEI